MFVCPLVFLSSTLPSFSSLYAADSWLALSLGREASGSNRSAMSLERPSRSMSLWKVLRTESSPSRAPRIRSRMPSTFYRTGKFWHGRYDHIDLHCIMLTFYLIWRRNPLIWHVWFINLLVVEQFIPSNCALGVYWLVFIELKPLGGLINLPWACICLVIENHEQTTDT